MKKQHLCLDYNEWRLIIPCLMGLRNSLIVEGRYTDCVDELIEKYVHARTVKVKIR
ncbi:MAG: hypothetical protein K2M60_02790 [Lachnospiraceae bacterium]|nr:hypothetical protein [Lachnospiraceae bacterium]MDE6252829.1 hypothetical protein [Lachnospiraceae bacterium]